MLMPSIFGESLFDDWMDFPDERKLFGRRNPLYGKHVGNLMKTDVRETKDSYELDIDLPGFKKEDIRLELQDGYLTINASKGLDRDQKERKGRYIRQERYCGICQRSFYVGDGLSEDDIHARYKHGILRISVPKNLSKAEADRTYIAIDD